MRFISKHFILGLTVLWAAALQTSATTNTLSSRFNDWEDTGRCQLALQPDSSEGCPSCEGMARFWVTQPYLNTWISDVPLGYILSSGDEMQFKWTYAQRTHLPDQYWTRVLTVDGPIGLMRLAQRSFETRMASYTYRFRVMTNACWSHNWWAEIVVWDPTREIYNNAPTKPAMDHPWYPTRAWFPMTATYEGLILPGDGRVIPFNRDSASVPSGSSKVKVEIIGEQTPERGPEIPVPKLDIGYDPYPLTNNLVWVTNPQFGFKVTYPDDSQEIYGFVQLQYPNPAGTPSAYQCSVIQNTAHAFLTQRIDPHGRTSTVGYQKQPASATEPNYVVKYVVDCDGRTNSYSYNQYTAFELDRITDPYGRTSTNTYDVATMMLSGITDSAGLTSSFTYRAPSIITNYGQFSYDLFFDGWIGTMTTPYGATTFDWAEEQEPGAPTTDYKTRALLVTLPNAGHELYVFRHNASGTEPNHLATGVPSVSGWTFDNGSLSSTGGRCELYYRNSYHWGPRQFSAAVPDQELSSWLPPLGSLSEGLPLLVANDYRKARLKHWLVNSSDASEMTISDWLSSERPPSRDAGGQTVELRAWYAYQGQAAQQYYKSGTKPLIGCIAAALPDGSSQYQIRGYDSFGHLQQQRLSASRPEGGLGELTNFFDYAENGIDLLSVSNSVGQRVSFAYNASHQPTNVVDALNQVTTYEWDASTHNLTNVSYSSGQKVSLSYFPLAALNQAPRSTNAMLSAVTLQPQNLVEDFKDYTNGLPRVVWRYGTALADLWTTNYWDGLNRLTGVSFVDGTRVSNVFDRLDLAARKDRLDHWAHFGHNALQQLTSLSDTRSNLWQFDWCDCGSLTSILDPENNLTTFCYNNQGLLTNEVIIDADSPCSRTNFFDPLGRLERVVDGENRSYSLGYNNQGLRTSVSNAFGRLERVLFDEANRPIQVTDADNVTVTNQFDLLNRVIKRTWQDGIGESYGYSTNGLMAFTNRNGKTTRFTRDAAGRVTYVTNANLEVTRYAYNALDQTTDLWDGQTNHTGFGFNEFGWFMSKTNALGQQVLRLQRDANGQVTNSWTPEFGSTTYARDASGNVTNRTSPNPLSSASYGWDPLNRLTNMVDALGTTAFRWTGSGDLLSEAGPWEDDKISYGYKQGRRMSMGIGDSSYNFYQSYNYDSGWRLQALSSGAGAFTYGYSAANAASALVRTLALPNFASITNHYDSLGRLDYTALLDRWGHSLDGYNYTHDALGLRTNIVRELGLATNSVTVRNDSIGQITNWSAKEITGQLRLHEQFGFHFDKGGNLDARTSGNLMQTFLNDPVNQLTNVSRTGTLTVSGATPAPASSVTVNGQAAERYEDLTFARTNLSLSDGNHTFTIIAQNQYGSATNVQTANLPSSITLRWDLNGNLTNDSTRSFSYSPENQLLANWVAGRWKVEFVYDGLGRRRIERDYGWQGGTWTKTNELHFIYDGLLLVQVRDANNNILVTYTRGPDLSGTYGGAGGIGGLLARTDASASLFYHADGAGNITALMDVAGNVPGRYQYGPFGRLSGMWGPMAEANVMRFSSMPSYDKAGIVSYPFRDYDPALQRFLAQDPSGEDGGLNLYAFVYNDPLDWVDADGFAGTPVRQGPRTGPPMGGITEQILEETAWNQRRQLRNRYDNYLQQVAENAARAARRQEVRRQGLDPNMSYLQAPPGSTRAPRQATPPCREDQKPVNIGQLMTYEDFLRRSVVGDKLEGHELWQHANLKSRSLATERLSTAASRLNPVIVLDRATHQQVNAAQRVIDPASQTPLQNIDANAAILRSLNAARNNIVDQLQRMAHEHAQRYGQ